MRHAESGFSSGPRRSWAQLAGAAGVALWFGLAPTGTLAATTCGVSTPGLAFGNYDVFNAAVTNGNATLTVTCTLTPPPSTDNESYTLTLSTGSSGSFVQRQMKSGTDTLNYNLYTSNAYSVVWGDGTGTTKKVTGSKRLTSGNPTQTNQHTVYGQIPALQDAAVGSYLDNVTVTVTF
jgi:spore coat protein U-like protein